MTQPAAKRLVTEAALAALVAPRPSADATGGVDTAALQSLIDAAEAAGGGVVGLAAGTYRITGLSIPSLVHLRGYGRGITVLKRVGTGAGPFVKTDEWTTRNGINSTVGAPNRFAITDLTIDANHIGGHSTGHGLAIHGYGYSLRGLDIINAPSCGWWSEYGPNLVAEQFIEATVDDVRVLNCDGDGTSVVRFRGPSDTLVSKLITAAPDSLVADSSSVWHILVDRDAWNSIWTDFHCWGHPGLGFRNDIPVELNNPNLEPACSTGTMIAFCPNYGGYQYGTRVMGGTLFYGGPTTERNRVKGVVFGTSGTSAWNVSMHGTRIVNCSAGALDWTYHNTASSDIDVFVTEDAATAKSGGPQVGSPPGAVNLRMMHDTGAGPTSYGVLQQQVKQTLEQVNATAPAQRIRENYAGTSSALFQVEGKYDGAILDFPPVFRIHKDFIQLGTNAVGIVDRWGAGSPEGVVAGSPGSTYRRTNGGAGTCFYVKESGTGTTGWVAK